MSDKGLEQVEPPMYELDQNRLGQFEVGLSWLEGQPSWPELVVRQEADGVPWLCLMRACAWLGHSLVTRRGVECGWGPT